MYPECLSGGQNALRMEARSLLALHDDMEEMVRLGAYRAGSNPEVDRAMRLAPGIEDLLRQGKDDEGSADAAFAVLADIVAMPPETGPEAAL